MAKGLSHGKATGGYNDNSARAGKAKLSKSPHVSGGTGPMRTKMGPVAGKERQIGPPAGVVGKPAPSGVPGPADLAANETYGEHGPGRNGSVNDEGLMDRGRQARAHYGRGFSSELMKQAKSPDNV